MSIIVKTDAIVLKTMDYRDTSKIITLYTRELGKIAGIMKGVRGSKTMYGNSLDPMAHVGVVLYEKKGRELQLITQCESREKRKNLFTDIDTMMLGMSVVEIVRDIAHEQEQNTALYDLVAATLTALDAATRNAVNILFAFELRLADRLGFTMQVDSCLACGRAAAPSELGGEWKYDIERGGPVCPDCASGGSNLADAPLDVLRSIAFFDKPVSDPTTLSLSPITAQKVETLLWRYLHFHVTGIRTLKSRSLYAAITNSAT